MDGSLRIEGHDMVAAGRNYRIKRLNIAPGGAIGERLYRHRTEQYVVLAGEARITRDEAVVCAVANASVFIPAGTPHRVENPGRGTLSVLEVQVGSRFEEDDFQGA